MRYYITTALAVVVLQLLIYSFCNTLTWLLKLSSRVSKAVRFIGFFAINALLICHLLHLVTAYRQIALLLVLLLFAFFVRLAAQIIYWLSGKNPRLNWGLRIIYPFAYLGLIGLSVYNAYTPKIVHYQVQLDKKVEPFRIGVASDFHLGKLFGGKQLDQLAEIFKQQKVDLILLPGDIMDDNLKAYQAEEMQPHLAKLQAPLGVYATLGNHDFFGEQAKIAQAIRQAGIQVLWDQAVTFKQRFAIIGRNDDLEKHRPSTQALLAGVNLDLPIILMDHRPSEIELHAKLPIDIQVSGHTHNGQIFPANFITRLTYRLSYGYEKIGNGHFFVTSGYGFWGVPMRLGSQSEVLIIDVKGK